MNRLQQLLTASLLAVAGSALAGIPASVVDVKPGNYSGGTITQVAADTYRLTGTHNWTSNNVYKLWGIILVADGAVLNVGPGTVIRGLNPATIGGNLFRPGTLVVERGGRIYARGTASAPICMTDEWDNNFPWFGSSGSTVTQGTWNYYDASGTKNVKSGQSYDYGKIGNHHGVWGGLVLCGKAFVSWDAAATLGSAEISVEGLDSSLGVKGGGTDDNDSSGEVSYLQVRYGGYVLASTKEINGVTFYGVGRGTKINHVEVYNNIDDCFEWFGGTVNSKYLVAWGAGDDIFDSDTGFRGKNQFLLGVQRNMSGNVESGTSDKGMEMDGFEKNVIGADYLVPASLWANVTLVGIQYANCNYYSSGWKTQKGRNVGLSLRDNASPRIYNSVVMDFGSVATLIENRSGADLTGTLNSTLHFKSASTAANFPSVTCATGATAGMDSTGVLSYLYGDGVLTDNRQACIRGSIFFNCPAGVIYTGAGGDTMKNTFDWVSSSVGSGPWISSGQTAYDGFINDQSADYDIMAYNLDNSAISDMALAPIVSRTRAQETVGAMTTWNISKMDPRAANEAAYSGVPVPDQWLTPVRFVGAMPADRNWAKGWTTVDMLGGFEAATSGDVVVGGTVSASTGSGDTVYVTNNITQTVTNTVVQTVTNGVYGVVYQDTASAVVDTGSNGVTAQTFSTSPVLTYTIATAGVYQLQATTLLSPANWQVVKTFRVDQVPVTVNLTDIMGATPENSANSQFYKLLKQ